MAPVIMFIFIAMLACWAFLLCLARKNPGVIALLAIPLGIACLYIGLNCQYSDIELIANFLFPPDDMHLQIVSTPLSEESTVYPLAFTNKYPGNYSISIQIPSGYKRPAHEEAKTILGMHCRIFDGSKLVREELHKDGEPVWGAHKIYAFSYWYYKVPQDLPRSVPLQFEITLLGDIAQFLAENKGAKLVIGKGSDE